SNVAAGEVGERVFILNPSEEAALAEGPFKFALKQAASVGRTAWLCASNGEADVVERLVRDHGLTAYRLRSGGDDDALERWHSAGPVRGPGRDSHRRASNERRCTRSCCRRMVGSTSDSDRVSEDAPISSTPNRDDDAHSSGPLGTRINRRKRRR